MSHAQLRGARLWEADIRGPDWPGTRSGHWRKIDRTACRRGLSGKAMHSHCILGHHWAGCRCERCGALRDRDHDWIGCRCSRCGLVREEEHDWDPAELAHCRFKCRRCGHHGEVGAHDWLGCVCKRCGATVHQWSLGKCLRCGEPCPHLHKLPMFSGTSSGHTAHNSLCPCRVCEQCGQVV